MQNSDTKYELKRDEQKRTVDRIGSDRIESERISGLGTVVGV